MNTNIIPHPQNKQTVWYKNGSTQDIINSVNRAAREPITKAETAALAQQLMGRTLKETCRNIYNYLRTLNYEEDEIGKQYIPTISQVVHSRHRVDCKGESLIVAGLLQNMNIEYFRRFARYPDPNTGSHNTEATHVYTIVPTSTGSVAGGSGYICIDGTLPTFTEAPDALEVFDFKDDIKPGSINGIGQQPFYPGYDNTVALYPVNTTHPSDINHRPSLLVIQLKKYYNMYASQVEGRPSLIGKWTPFKDIKNAWQDRKEYSFGENAAHTAAAVPFLAAREALKLIIENNVLGMGSILAYTKLKNSNAYKEILTKWYKYGGDTQNFDSAVNKGKTKVPRQVAPAVLNKIPQIKNYIEQANKIYWNKLAGVSRHYKIGVTGVDDATVASAAVSASIPWGSILGTVITSGALLILDKYLPDKKSEGDTGTGSGGDNNIPPQDSFFKKNAIPLALGGAGILALLFWNPKS